MIANCLEKPQQCAAQHKAGSPNGGRQRQDGNRGCVGLARDGGAVAGAHQQERTTGDTRPERALAVDIPRKRYNEDGEERCNQCGPIRVQKRRATASLWCSIWQAPDIRIGLERRQGPAVQAHQTDLFNAWSVRDGRDKHRPQEKTDTTVDAAVAPTAELSSNPLDNNCGPAF